jgi:hypothetical protein
MRPLRLAVAALALGLGAGAPEAAACGWLWACADRPYAYRDAPRAYGYWGPRRVHRYAGAHIYGYGYRPRRAIPTSRWYLGTALPATRTDQVGLTPPITTSQALLYSSMPARGPSLFGPPIGWGYAYGSYYGDPAYGYYAVPSPSVPPQDTPSWWIEPRRRR